MATKPNTNPAGQGPQHFHSPTARELRAQSMNRLLVGLAGLAMMLLLVALANIIMDRARQSDAASGQASPAAAAGENTNPLADVGAEPSPDASAKSTQRPATGH